MVKTEIIEFGIYPDEYAILFHHSLANLKNFTTCHIFGCVPYMAKSGRAENLLDVLTKYVILGFCELDQIGQIKLIQNLRYHDRKTNISR